MCSRHHRRLFGRAREIARFSSALKLFIAHTDFLYKYSYFTTYIKIVTQKTIYRT